ncbi:CHASE2 domain-containing protein [Pantanalinema sp. GBBB05]|uniref:CHASE2 domain-containing protein n=1 Tax=Pantanalinema sp. GBBB05 TaxID=2604139 RepID=UPI003D812B80
MANAPAIVTTILCIGITSTTITGILVGARQLGWGQQPELLAYDQMMRLRPDQPPDPRLLIVAITEADIYAQQRWPLSDRTIAQVLDRLQQYQPRVIGLDVYRDLPQEPGHQALSKQLQQPNVIVITQMPDDEDIGVAPPPGVPAQRIGFNDVFTDPDAVIRRGLLFANPDETTTLSSFSLRLALAYLRPANIVSRSGLSNPDHLQLGTVEFTPLEPTSGAYQTVDASGYQILLNYRTRRNLARQVTLSQVLNGQVDRQWIKDKIVLIGATARSLRDVHLTPYSAAETETPKMAGVMIHAQMTSQILSTVLDHQPLFWFWADWVEVVWIATWTVLGGCLAWFTRHPLLVGVYGVVAIGGLLLTSYSMFLQQGWIPVATPAIGLLMSAGVLVAYRAQQAQRQQQMMMKLLGQNTSPEIASALWKSRDRLLKSGKLPGQRLTATMLFTDIKNFSTISESMPPENLLEWLNEYLSAITQQVRANQGIINKFTGDGMLAVFGVPMNRTTPIEVSQDAQLAVNCALAMGECLQKLNQDWEQRGLPTIQMRVGIFTGPIVAGSLGGKDRLEYGVIGDSVNIASRLESYDKERQTDLCRVLIAKDTLVHLQERFEVEHWGLMTLKGKHHLVDVYRVVGYATGREKSVGSLAMGNILPIDPINQSTENDPSTSS